MQQLFETELPDSLKQPDTYARHLLEFCSYKALHFVTRRPDYLADKEFQSLTFDMMLAWEAPATESESLSKVRHLNFFSALCSLSVLPI